jgi:phage tail sheath protein FI
VTSWSAFTATYGGLSANSEASYAIQQFFLNGGSMAWVVRVAGSSRAPALATAQLLNGTTPILTVNTVNQGTWGNSVQVVATTSAVSGRFDLLVQQLQPSATGTSLAASESYRGLSMTPGDPNYALTAVNGVSQLIVLLDDEATVATKLLPDTKDPGKLQPTDWTPLASGDDGGPLDTVGLLGDQSATGLYALDRIAPAVFNLVCVPAIVKLGLSAADYSNLVSSIEAFCVARRAFLILDPPLTVKTQQDFSTWFTGLSVASPNAAIYFPSLSISDALAGGQPRIVGPSGTVAGVYARTDASRGVWKAAAGVDATVAGATLTTLLTDDEEGALNPFGLNCIRNFPLYGTIIWGARTLDGADAMASPWKYVPVRRTALYIEESVAEGLRWAVFEPNDDTLWAQIRATVDEFMAGLFRQGAFQGTTPDQAYLVKCDADTTTQGDIDRGVVNVLVGFAPVKPAEFVVLQLEQLAGQGS